VNSGMSVVSISLGLARAGAKICVVLFIIVMLIALLALLVVPDCTSGCSATERAFAYSRWTIQLVVAWIGIWIAVRNSLEPRLVEYAAMVALLSLSALQLGLFHALGFFDAG
jgi:hypothetical protein